MSISKVLNAQTHLIHFFTLGANTFDLHCSNTNPACTNWYEAALLADWMQVPFAQKKIKNEKNEHAELVSWAFLPPTEALLCFQKRKTAIHANAFALLWSERLPRLQGWLTAVPASRLHGQNARSRRSWEGSRLACSARWYIQDKNKNKTGQSCTPQENYLNCSINAKMLTVIEE